MEKEFMDKIDKEYIEKIYDMKAFERLYIGDGDYMIRVSGGWVYRYAVDSSIFIPYNEEFKGKEKI